MFDLKAILPLTLASIKMYFRDKTAVFFTFVFPIIFLLVFGFINSSGSLTLDVAYFNALNTEASKAFDAEFQNLVIDEEAEDNEGKIFRIDEEIASVDEAKVKLSESDLNAIIVIPENMTFADGGDIQVFIDESNATFGEVVSNTVSSIIGGFNKQANIAANGTAPLEPFLVTTQGVQSSELDAIDYLVPGIIAFSILSLGVFSITEGFIQLKTNGSLRRLQVAPIEPGSFLVAQSLTRMLMTILNVITMVVLAVVLFNFQIQGNVLAFMTVAVFGTILFLGFGYAIAGWAKDGNQAAPVSNLIFFPMMFLSGTFFPRETFPEWLQPITEYMPLTYVADGMRRIANDGASLFDIGPELAGIAIWTVIIYFIAIKVFRWE